MYQGRIQDFKLGGAHLKKLRREKGGAKIFGIFRVKNHDFTPKNHIFPILGVMTLTLKSDRESECSLFYHTLTVHIYLTLYLICL
jgi:hypothetical protein